MLHYAVVFLVIALIAAVLGFGGIAAGAAGIAKILFVVFVILAVATFLFGRNRGGVLTRQEAGRARTGRGFSCRLSDRRISSAAAVPAHALFRAADEEHEDVARLCFVAAAARHGRGVGSRRPPPRLARARPNDRARPSVTGLQFRLGAHQTCIDEVAGQVGERR